MNHTEDLVKQATEASIKALENNYQESQKLASKKTRVRNIATFANTYIFHKIGLHITTPEIIDGFSRHIIGPMGEWSCSGSFESFLHKPEKWDEVYEMLSDDYSKDTFDWFVKYRTAVTLAFFNTANQLYPFKPLQNFSNRSIIKKRVIGNQFTIGDIKIKWIDEGLLICTFDYNQYSYLDKVNATTDDIVIDAGAYKGDTALYFAPKIGKNGIVYAFEPDSENFTHLQGNIKLNNARNIQPIRAGVGFRGAEAKQTGSGGGISLQVINAPDKETNKIKIYSIDGFLMENTISKVNFIKMDIEGWELDALKGAENCLKNYKPKLAICVYHKPEDLLNIANYLKLIVPEYQLYLDHKSKSWGETILYATIAA